MNLYFDPTKTAPRVLVVEDEALLRELLVDAISDLGATVEAVETADAGLLAMGRPGIIDLLVTDVRTPGRLSGFDLAAAVQAKQPDLPIIITSGYCFETPLGVPTNATFVQKPWSLAMICDLVKARLVTMN